MTNRNLFQLLVFVGGLSACGAGDASHQAQALLAGPEARAFGVDHYRLMEDGAVLFDSADLELGRFTVTAPSPSERHFAFAFTNGLVDDVDVSRVVPGKVSAAPLQVETIVTAVLVDEALAPFAAKQGLDFFALVPPSPEVLAPSNFASTTVCTTPVSTPWSNNDGSGCARPANASLGCTNNNTFSPPTLGSIYPAVHYGNDSYTQTYSGCTNYYCGPYGGAKQWSQNQRCECNNVYSSNTYVASCPPSSCSGSSYDGVPRQRNCVEPGTCTNAQGAISCVSWH